MARTAHFHLSKLKKSTVPIQGVAVLLSIAAIIFCAVLLDVSVQVPLMFLAALFLIAWGYARGKRGVKEIALALLFALAITLLHPYRYEGFNAYFGVVNLYPLLLWSAALVMVKQLYQYLPRRNRFLLGCAMYLCLLFALEGLGYYVLGIRSSGNYPSFMGLGIIHGPPIIHWFYITAGPVYVWVAERLKV